MTEKRQNVRSGSFLLSSKSDILPVVSIYGKERVHLLLHAAKSRQLVLLSLTIGLLVTVRPSAPARNTRPMAGNTWPEELLRRGGVLFRVGSFPEAAAVFQEGVQSAVTRRDWEHAVDFLSNVGSS